MLHDGAGGNDRSRAISPGIPAEIQTIQPTTATSSADTKPIHNSGTQVSEEPAPVPFAYAIAIPPRHTEQVFDAAFTARVSLQQYATPESLLDSASSAAAGCVLLWSDRDHTRTSAMISQLKAWFRALPVIVLHDPDQESTTVALMRAGAFSAITHAAPAHELVDTITAATDFSLRCQHTVDEGRDAAARMKMATSKEREVLDLVMDGRKNREIAAALGITVRAVEDRRFRLMKKVRVDSVAQLVATAVQARYFEEGFCGSLLTDDSRSQRNCLKGIEVWTPHESDNCLRLSQSVYRDAAGFQEASRRMTFRRGEGLPGRIWQQQAPAFLHELITTEFVRTQVASDNGMTAAIGFPVFASGQVRAVVLFLLDTRLQMKAVFESWQYDSVSSTLRLTGGTYVNCERLRRLTAFMAFPVGKGLPGMAAEKHLPCAAARFAEGTAVRGVALAAEQLASGIALPLTDSGTSVDDVFLMFNAETSPLFSLVQVWTPTTDGSRLDLTSEYIDGIPSLTEPMQRVSKNRATGIADVAWQHSAPTIVDSSETAAVGIPSGQTVSASAGIAIPTIVNGKTVAVTVLGN